MAGMKVTGLDPVITRYSHMQQHLAREIRQHAIQGEARAVVEHARSVASSFGGSTRLAGEAVAMRATANGADLIAGGIGEKAAAVFAGSEFGAGGTRRTTYGRRGKRYVHAVTRRTTRQFRPFVGRTGYFYWPSVRSGLRGIGQRVEAAIVAELGG